MNAAHEVVHHALAGLGPFLLPFVIVTVLTLAAGLLIALRVPRLSASSRASLLLAAMSAPFLVVLFHASGVTPAAIQNESVQSAAVVAIDWTAGAVAPEQPARASFDWSCALALLWAIGFFAAVVRVAVERARWRRIARDATAVAHRDARRIFDALQQQRDLRADLVESASCREPVVVGIRRPRVVLPSGLVTRLDDESINAVFAHELAHVRRRDNIVGAAVALLRGVFWFSPLHHRAVRQYLLLRERACDEQALENGCSPGGLLAALKNCCEGVAPTTTAACMSSVQLPERIDSIMSHTSRHTRFIPSLVVRLVAASVALSIGLAAALLIPAPVIASPPPAADIEPVTMRPRVVAWAEETASGPKRVTLKIEVRDDRGEIVMAPTVATSPGLPFEVTSRKTVNGSETTIRVRGEVDSSYDGEVVVTWEENGRVLRSETATIVRGEPTRSTTPEAQSKRISLQVENADLHDVLRTFSALTGNTITAAPELSERVTIDVKDMPWVLALRRVAAQLGLTIEGAPAEGIRLVRRAEPTLAPGAHRVGGDVKAPRVVSRVNPRYPAAARQANVAGIVIIEALIDERGKLVTARVVKPLHHGVDEAALDAVRQWTFEPGTLDGVPVKVLFNLTINFKLD